MALKSQKDASPRKQYFFSLVQDGPRGLHALPEDDLEDVDLGEYGVDYDVHDNPVLMDHFNENNPDDDSDETNPFGAKPVRLSDVPCDAPDCPLTPDQVDRLDAGLARLVNTDTHDMTIRRTLWSEALQICLSFSP